MRNNPKCSEKRERFLEVSTEHISTQFYGKMAHERRNMVWKAEDRFFEEFPNAIRENFSENQLFVEKACSRLEEWSGRTLQGAVTILEILIKEEFPQEQERFKVFAQKHLANQKKERLKAKLLFDLSRR